MGTLEGRSALVTGGGRGIGRCIALALAAEGAGVAVLARSAGQTRAVAAEVAASGAKAVGLTGDVTDAASVAAAFEETAGRLGPIDILVNCAGDARSAPFTRTDDALWRQMFSVNLDGVFLCTRQALPSMLTRGWGRVINIASRAGLTGFAYVSAYCAAKHAVVGLTRALALEVADKGITVNAVCPGYVDTDMTRRSVERIIEKTGQTEQKAVDALARFNPDGRLIQPGEVAAMAVMLCSEEGATLNGQAMEI